MDLWVCTECCSVNTPSRARCYHCGMPRDPQASGPSNRRVRPLHVFMGLAVAAIVALGGIGTLTLAGLPTVAPMATPPAIAALPSGTNSATPSPSPFLSVPPTAAPSWTSAPTSSPPQSDRPIGRASPEPTEITPSRVINSANWSGYGLRNKQYILVSAEWTQPEVDCSAGPEADASLWVGLDGLKSRSVEQTGTSGHCLAGHSSAEYYAWYEMYPEAARQAPIEVRPGDHFSALVHASSAEKFELTLKNLTTGTTFTTSASRTGRWPTSAEWVVEPAAVCKTGCAMSQLAQFADVTFTSLAAETTDGSITFATASNQLVRFDLRSKKGARLDHVSSLAGDGPTFDISWTGSSR